MRNEVNPAMDYMSDLFGAKDREIEDLFFGNNNHYNKMIQISRSEAKILQLMIKMNNITTVVEVGTLAGYSAMCMASVLPENGMVFSFEKNERHAEIAMENFSKINHLSNKIKLFVGSAEERLSDIEPYGQFDMMFIDANKGGYLKYLDWSEKNVKKLIIADNTLLFNSVFLPDPPRGISKNSWSVVREFNKRLSDESKYCSVMLPTSEGMVIALKK